MNIRYTLSTLLKYGAVPVINENDSVSTEEIKCGDNDRLSFLVSDLAESDMLVILTNVDGLYDNDGQLVKKVDDITDDIKSMCWGKTCEVSTGGMLSKLDAAKGAMLSGIECVITSGRAENSILEAVDGNECCTRFEPVESKISARKRWIAFSIKPKGSIYVDAGAGKAVSGNMKSLLSSGITGISGKFGEGDVVDIVDENDTVVARGLTNYSAGEIEKIKGRRSAEIENILGYKDYDEVIHRDNLVVMGQ